MFSGIIKNTGRITKILRNNKNTEIEISSNLRFIKNEVGSSISCSGTCLTLEKYRNKFITFFVSKETYKRTSM